jgi:hypothetical protein
MLQNFDRARVFLDKARKISPTEKNVLKEIENLNEYLFSFKIKKLDIISANSFVLFERDIARYHAIEKSTCQRMFGYINKNSSDAASEVDDLKLDEKESLTKTKNVIIQKLE